MKEFICKLFLFIAKIGVAVLLVEFILLIMGVVKFSIILITLCVTALSLLLSLALTKKFDIVHERSNYSEKERFERQQERERERIEREVKESVERRNQAKKEEKRQEEIKQAQHPQCPACHGYNTQRITTASRVIGTAMVGLASSTIGKQYECLDCKHKW